MPSFSLTPLDPFPPVAGPFPSATQFQDEHVNVGPPGPKYVDFTGAGVTASYTPSSGTVVVNIPGGGGSGVGKLVSIATHNVGQTSGEILIYDNVFAYNPTIGVYDSSNGIFSALVEGLYSFNATCIIQRSPITTSGEKWYLIIGKYDSAGDSITAYSMDQFGEIRVDEVYLTLAASVSANIYLNSGELAVVATREFNNRKFLSGSFFFPGGLYIPAFGEPATLPTLSITYLADS
jgi:hypothetical protein